MKPGRPKLKLAIPLEQYEEVRRLYRETRQRQIKERSHAVLLAYRGQHTYEEMAEVFGRARSTIQVWIKDFCEHGLGSLQSGQGQGGGSAALASTAARDNSLAQ